VSMVRRLLVKSALVMFGRLPMVAGGVGKMLRGFLMVFRSFLRHQLFSLVVFQWVSCIASPTISALQGTVHSA
jgi:hypothetical protein